MTRLDAQQAPGLPTPDNVPEAPPTAPVPPVSPIDDPDTAAPTREEPDVGDPGTSPGGPPAPMVA